MRISDWSSDVCSSDLIHRVSDGSVAMSDALHIVVTIEISSAFGIEEPGSFAANDFGWLVIKEHAATQIFGSPSNEPLSAPVEPPIVREVGEIGRARLNSSH